MGAESGKRTQPGGLVRTRQQPGMMLRREARRETGRVQAGSCVQVPLTRGRPGGWRLDASDSFLRPPQT